MHLMEAIGEVQLRLLIASAKGETFNIKYKGQACLSIKKWKKK